MRPGSPKPGPPPYVVRAALLFALYFGTARLGLSLGAVSGFATAVWPPTGIALVALLLFGYRLWSATDQPSLAEAAALVARRDVTPSFVLIELLAFLNARKIVRPGYTALQTCIGDALTAERGRLERLSAAYPGTIVGLKDSSGQMLYFHTVRQIVAALKTTGDLERSGDYAANVAKRSIVLAQFSLPYSLAGLAHMAVMVQGQLKSIIDALGDNDADKAVEVWRSDQVVDDIYNAIFRELITYMMEDARSITPCTHLLFIAKNLERIGDHAPNIAGTVSCAPPGTVLTDDAEDRLIGAGRSMDAEAALDELGHDQKDAPGQQQRLERLVVEAPELDRVAHVGQQQLVGPGLLEGELDPLRIPLHDVGGQERLLARAMELGRVLAPAAPSDGEGEAGQKVYDALVRAIPMKRVGQPDDMPGIVAFLASDDAAFITGQVINIDGGVVNS